MIIAGVICSHLPPTLHIVLLLAGDPLHQEEAGGKYLEHDGEAEEGNQESSIGSAQLHSVAQLIGVGREQSYIHQTLCYQICKYVKYLSWKQCLTLQ